MEVIKVEFSSGLPIYSQIVDRFKRQIASGEMKPGGKVLTVRELAVEMGVNPNTMQRALAALELEGLVYAERTSGRFVTEDKEVISNVRRSILADEAARFARSVKELGFSKEEALEIFEKSI